jgi:alpha-tubulin suppressor-like RCC1 family protein
VQVHELSDVVAITSGYRSNCALLAGGDVRCWGYNGQGQLGDGTTMEHYLPAAVAGLDDGAVAIGMGNSHACAVIGDGRVACWGRNAEGQLGDGTHAQSLLPVPVANLSTALSIAVGYDHTCALTAAGGLECWGNNNVGELGDGTVDGSDIPVDIPGLSGRTRFVSAGYQSTCAIDGDGRARCWGTDHLAGPGGYFGPVDVPTWYVRSQWIFRNGFDR